MSIDASMPPSTSSMNRSSMAGFIFLLAAIAASRAWSYLLFHSLAELFSIIIAASYFLVAWHTRKYNQVPSLVTLGVAYAFIAFLDLFHTLAYAGMGLFPGYLYPANQLWVAARFLEAVSLLSFNAYHDKVGRRTTPLVVVYSLYSTAILASIFILRIFPACFVAGSGQTVFKVAAEAVIIAILLVAGWTLHRNRARYSRDVYVNLILSIFLTVLSELSFTLYISNFDWLNMTGHMLKIASFYLIYRSIMVTGLERPQEQMFAKLKTSELELNQSNEAKNTFFSILSHDLKSPLSGIESASEFLVSTMGGSIDQRNRTMLAEIGKAATASLALVDKVLAWARCQSGAIIPATTGIDALASIREQAEILHEAATNKGVRLEVPASGEIMVAADRDMLDAVLRNLLQNAVKFSPAGASVSVHAYLDGTKWQISVDDAGIGMDADELGKLFKVDGHLHRNGTNGEKGAGFGLILSMEFTRLMKGRLDVTSVPGKGSSFRLSLPAYDSVRLIH